MNKKGFTLVELLAVIAILAILVIIAMPSVTGMLNKARVNSFTTEVQEISRQAATQAVADSIYNTDGLNVTYYSKGSGLTFKAGMTDPADAKDLQLEGAEKAYNVLVSNGEVTKIIVADSRFCWAIGAADSTPANYSPAEIQKKISGYVLEYEKDTVDLANFNCGTTTKANGQ